MTLIQTLRSLVEGDTHDEALGQHQRLGREVGILRQSARRLPSQRDVSDIRDYGEALETLERALDVAAELNDVLHEVLVSVSRSRRREEEVWDILDTLLPKPSHWFLIDVESFADVEDWLHEQHLDWDIISHLPPSVLVMPKGTQESIVLFKMRWSAIIKQEGRG